MAGVFLLMNFQESYKRTRLIQPGSAINDNLSTLNAFL